MSRTLRGQRMLVTGASSGIGKCLAELAAARGAQVALAARSTEKLHELARILRDRGASVLPVPCDVGSEADREHLLETVADEFGGLDALVNCAGVASFGQFANSTEEILRQIMEVNFFGPAELIRRAIPLLRDGEKPAVVNVASMCGRMGMPAWTEYSASKFALSGLTEALRAEFSRFSIDVLLILPGLTASDLPRHLLRNEGRMKIGNAQGMPLARVAEGILRALERNQSELVLGCDARWMLRMNRFFPRLVERITLRRVRELYADSAASQE